MTSYEKYTGGKGRWKWDKNARIWYDSRAGEHAKGGLKTSHGTTHKVVAGKMGKNGKWDTTGIITLSDGTRFHLNSDGTTTKLSNQPRGQNGRVTYSDKLGNIYEWNGNRRIVNANPAPKPSERRQYINQKLNDARWKLDHPLEANGLKRELAEMNGTPIVNYYSTRPEDLDMVAPGLRQVAGLLLPEIAIADAVGHGIENGVKNKQGNLDKGKVTDLAIGTALAATRLGELSSGYGIASEFMPSTKFGTKLLGGTNGAVTRPGIVMGAAGKASRDAVMKATGSLKNGNAGMRKAASTLENKALAAEEEALAARKANVALSLPKEGIYLLEIPEKGIKTDYIQLPAVYAIDDSDYYIPGVTPTKEAIVTAKRVNTSKRMNAPKIDRQKITLPDNFGTEEYQRELQNKIDSQQIAELNKQFLIVWDLYGGKLIKYIY